MDKLFWMFAVSGWLLLLIPLLKRKELPKEKCRLYCKIGCVLGICATICFLFDISARSRAMWNGDVSEQLYIGLLSVTMIPLGVCIIIFVITHILRK